MVLVCMGEYVDFYGGIVLDVLVVMNIMMICVNGILEWDFNIILVFVEDND